MNIIKYTPGMQINAPCLISDMPNDVYHSLPDMISKSGLDLIDRSPAHYQYSEPRNPTRTMEIGSAIHCAILEPDLFHSDYVLLRQVKDRRASEYKAAIAVHGSERVLVGHEADAVAGMQESVYANSTARGLLTDIGHNEISLFVNDPETGLMVRVRYDRLNDGVAVDLKKTQDARHDGFSKSIYNYRYHVQAALYSDAYFWATGEQLDSFRFLAVEEKMPHASMVYRLDDTALADGRKQYRHNLTTYAECISSGYWPAYEATGDDIIGLPDFVIRQLEYDLDDQGIKFTGE